MSDAGENLTIAGLARPKQCRRAWQRGVVSNGRAGPVSG